MTKERIKAAAVVQFGENGYEGATLGAIAKAVGIKTPSIYAFFESKETLFLTVYREVLDDHLAHIQKVKEDIPAREKLYSILQNVQDYHLHETSKTKFLNGAMIFPPKSLQQSLHEEFLQEEDVLSNLLSDIFEQGMSEGEIKKHHLDDLCNAFFCLLDGAFLQLIYYSPSEFEARIESSWKLFWLGISNMEE